MEFKLNENYYHDEQLLGKTVRVKCGIQLHKASNTYLAYCCLEQGKLKKFANLPCEKFDTQAQAESYVKDHLHDLYKSIRIINKLNNNGT